MKTITLTPVQATLLHQQHPGTETGGGFQSLLVKLQRQYNPATNELTLDDSDLERIPRYAFDYGQGGWENRLAGIFGPALGPRLGR
jgi:hypothetical protein